MPMLLGFGAVNHLENCFFTDLYLVLFLRIRLQHRNLVKLESEDAAAGLFFDPADRTSVGAKSRYLQSNNSKDVRFVEEPWVNVSYSLARARSERRFVSVMAESRRAPSDANASVGPFHRSLSTSSKSAMSVRRVASVRNRTTKSH